MNARNEMNAMIEAEKKMQVVKVLLSIVLAALVALAVAAVTPAADAAAAAADGLISRVAGTAYADEAETVELAGWATADAEGGVVIQEAAAEVLVVDEVDLPETAQAVGAAYADPATGEVYLMEA